MDLIAKILSWVLIVGAVIGLLIMLIGYAKDDSRLFHFGFRVVLLLSAVGVGYNIIIYS